MLQPKLSNECVFTEQNNLLSNIRQKTSSRIGPMDRWCFYVFSLTINLILRQLETGTNNLLNLVPLRCIKTIDPEDLYYFLLLSILVIAELSSNLSSKCSVNKWRAVGGVLFCDSIDPVNWMYHISLVHC